MRERDKTLAARVRKRERERNEPNLKCSIYCDNAARVVCENLLLFFIFCVLLFVL